MGIVDDERGQAVQVGAVLLFAVLVISFATYQAFTVPSQNREVEFNHNQQVQGEFQDLRNAILAAGQGEGTPVSVGLGVRYPSRLFAINPGPVTGAIRTQGTTNAGVQAWVNNTQARGETGDFWDGTDRNFSTGSLVYQPNYNVYTEAPTTVYENSIVYNKLPDENVTITDQQLVRDRRISLVALNGSLSLSRAGSASVDVDELSASTRSVSVTNTPGERLTIAVPTKLPESRWGELLQTQIQRGHVTDYGVDQRAEEFNLLEVEMEAGINYTLSLSRVGVGTNQGSTDAEYLTTVSGDDARVSEDETRSLVVEVRDRFNNPISGIKVDTRTTDSLSSVTDGRTDEEGRATLTYQAPRDIDGKPQSDTIQASYTVDPADVATFDEDAPENVTVDVTVENTDGSGTGTSYGISFDENAMAGQDGVTCSDGECTYDYADDTDTEFDLITGTTPTVVGAAVDFGLNTTDYGIYSAEASETDGDGTATATFDGTGTGQLTTYVTSGSGGDSLDLWLRDTTGSSPLLTAVGPDPAILSDSQGEFVRVTFPAAIDTSGWTIIDNEGDAQNTSLPDATLDGNIYFARDPSVFADQWDLDASRVYKLDTQLNDGGEPLQLVDDSETVVDQMGYNGETTSGFSGSVTGVGEGDVAYRTQSGGAYQDTDADSDWGTDTEGSFFYDPGVVFAGTSNGDLSTVDTSGRVARDVYGVNDVTAVGPQTTDFAFDGGLEVPYKDGNGVLGITDLNGNRQTLVDANTYGPGINDARLAVGTVSVANNNDYQTGGGPFVYFINGDGDLTQVDASGAVQTIDGTSAQAVAGTGDIDGDGTAELVYVDTNGQFSYLNDRSNGKVETVQLSGSPTLNTPNAVGAPADFDGDGADEIPYIDGSSRVMYVNGPDGTDTEGSTTELLSNAGGEVPVGVADVADDSTPEVVYVDQKGTARLAYAGVSSDGFLTDASGNDITAKAETGAS